MNQRIVVTGASGYLGRRVALAACAAFSDVWGLIHQSAADDSVSIFQVDITNEAALLDCLEQLRPTALIHTAAITPAAGARLNERNLWNVNVLASATIARWTAQQRVRLVHVSSDAIWGGRDTPYTEDDPPAPINAYGASKAAAEAVVQALNPHAAIVRTSLIYGCDPPDSHTLMAWDMACGRRRGVLFEDEFRCPIFVDDLAAALVELGQRSDAGPIHAVGPQALSRAELGMMLIRWAGGDPARVPVGTAAASGVRRPSRVVVQARRLLSFAHPLRSIADVVAQEVYRGTLPQSDC